MRAREFDRALDRQLPRMVQIEIRYLARQQQFVRQAREIVARGEFRDRQRGIRRGAHGFEHNMPRLKKSSKSTKPS